MSIKPTFDWGRQSNSHRDMILRNMLRIYGLRADVFGWPEDYKAPTPEVSESYTDTDIEYLLVLRQHDYGLVPKKIKGNISGSPLTIPFTDDGAGALVFSSYGSVFSGTINYQTGELRIAVTGSPPAALGASIVISAESQSNFGDDYGLVYPELTRPCQPTDPVPGQAIIAQIAVLISKPVEGINFSDFISLSDKVTQTSVLTTNFQLKQEQTVRVYFPDQKTLDFRVVIPISVHPFSTVSYNYECVVI